MKERIYNSMPDAMFCPNCHRKVESPIRGFKIKITGNLRIGCGHCKGGAIVIKGEEIKK